MLQRAHLAERHAIRKRWFAERDLRRWPAPVKEEDIGLDVRIWSKDIVWQPHDRAHIEIRQQLLPDTHSDSGRGQCAVWHDDCRPATSWLAAEFAHNELEEQQRSLCRLF